MNVNFTITARAHFQTIRNSFVKFHKGCHQRVRGVARISYALPINFASIGARIQINDLVKMRKERERYVLARIIPKEHAHLRIMTETSAKFQKEQSTTVCQVAHTTYLRHTTYLLSEVGTMHYHYENKPIQIY